jgi:hypothetical protein
MSMRNKITILGTGGSIFEGFTPDVDVDCEERYISDIISNLKSLERYDSTYLQVVSFKYMPMKEILDTLTPEHIQVISIVFDLYEDMENFPFEYETALALYERNEYVKEVSIILEDDLDIDVSSESL